MNLSCSTAMLILYVGVSYASEPLPYQRLERAKDNIKMFLRILYAEDNRLVYEAVKETFELEGWEIEIGANGFLALEKIKSDVPYDLFLIDNDLSGIEGMELILVIKSLPHRKHTPTIMLSASDVEHEAKRVDADLFLRKRKTCACW